MKFTAAAFLLAAIASAEMVSIKFDPGYDDGSRSLTQVACSDGATGLIPKGYNTQRDVPGFPNIGGSWQIAGWGSPQCGICYKVSYAGQTINVVGVDSTASGLNLSKAAMNTLTGNRADELGVVQAEVTRVESAACGFPASKRSIEFMA